MNRIVSVYLSMIGWIVNSFSETNDGFVFVMAYDWGAAAAVNPLLVVRGAVYYRLLVPSIVASLSSGTTDRLIFVCRRCVPKNKKSIVDAVV